ncbi:hypothetical protein [Sporomusa sphaeroides]|uniref:Uncharacterized protein n=1 Tax=Sporomusa sphaeroides DSM 2875 TaxID=1337886 RepID=A0A1U7MA51_9FIRM|nr:hypothetical protein [Sporomusa sphaeroides]OLS54347.1 hypothetical protein SPSPH_45930 [Sporomusa sphaeroides DSM 2875]CVK21643.1 hypothetical protein SSPH_04338 [Sporomusa sphaeroides DSM 2875]
MNLQIDYDELMNLIKEGILQNNKDEIIGLLLQKGLINTCNQENWDKQAYSYLDSVAYSIIISLKKHFKDELKIIEEDAEIMTILSELS